MRQSILNSFRPLVSLSLAATIGLTSFAKAQNTVELSPLPLDRSQEAPSLAILGLNSNVLGEGSLAFEGGYNSADWSGVLKAVTVNGGGVAGETMWDAGALLTDPDISSPEGRTVLTARRGDGGAITGMGFEPQADFDDVEMHGLMSPASEHAADTMMARVNYLRGDRISETDGGMRKRISLLGAILHSQAIYVGYPSSNYIDTWPKQIGGVIVSAPEAQPGAQRYADFVSKHANRPPALYVGANDGMLHVFHAPIPACKTRDSNNRCTAYNAVTNAGREWWAYVPRAVYGNLGNLTSANHFHFQPTVDATPVVRDVFFSERGHHEWHTLLVGGLRLGGRGVYALDITDPDAASEAFPRRTVLWEFDADSAPGTTPSNVAYNPVDLDYTYGQPAIARLANGRWTVLIPSGYFADCSAKDKPIHCEESSGTPPAAYSALFVLDAQTGEVIAELKTPTSIDGVRSYGLTTPVLGDYNNDQVDNVAFAGDLAGNLWRFDLSSPNPSKWMVALAYRAAAQGAQPITSMPRLFPDPATNRFIVVFGTGKYLGDDDKANEDVATQSIYGIRDKLDAEEQPITSTRQDLQSQMLTESVAADQNGQGASATVRSLTSNPILAKAGGWFIDLNVIAGERVVATPGAVFNTNVALVSTLIPHADKPGGAIMAIDAATGRSASIVSFGGTSYAGALVETPLTTGTLPAAARMGGGKLILPDLKLRGVKNGLDTPVSLDSSLWRRRSWQVLTPDS
ncbi:PilC/PilY family type IV pilus protein [Dyella sp. 2HG41-7]|uniref:pilus assembly protein n=1 Tax=Dyella sp. 2HG41-7 TaxID=2883239 RepID=UPI001F21B630|nr:PilC/PilY family type IV pilus protein [Dyella sp. 2HG41-7]